MFYACAPLPQQELFLRQEQCRDWCRRLAPDAGGVLLFSRLAQYYLTGTLADGVLWLPLQGKALLLVRRGKERCLLESPHTPCCTLPNMATLSSLCAEAGVPLPEVVAVDMAALHWHMGESLQKALPQCRFVPADALMAQCRARKTAWELAKMRLAGLRHHRAVYELLPQRIHAGMSEYEIGRIAWQILFSLGHCGPNRMAAQGEEVFLGHIAAGENGNYPSHFNGPLGLMGVHPSAPFMGNATSLWHKHSPLAVDIGFVLEGYHTDKTQCYWAGAPASVPDVVRHAYDLCVTIQTMAAEELRPGAIPSAIWAKALEYADKYGQTKAFMGLGGNQVPFLGHGIGLVIDEWPVIAQRFDAPLEKGMTLAIEPKIGIAGIGMVGVENTFIVTEKGGESITGKEYELLCVE